MEIESKNTGKGQEKSGCCSKIPCCSTTCRRCISCIVCTPCIIIGLFCCILLIWGASSGEGDPIGAGTETFVDFALDFTSGSPSDVVAAFNGNETLAAEFVDLVSDENGATFSFVSAETTTKQSGVRIKLRLTGNELTIFVNNNNFTLTIDVPTDAQIAALRPSTFSDLLFTSQSALAGDLLIKCTVRGITGNSFTRAFCVQTARVVLAEQGDTIRSAFQDAITGYELDDMDIRQDGRFWVAMRNTEGKTFTQVQSVDCDVDTAVDEGIADVKKKIKKYLGSSCTINLRRDSGRNCKVLLNSVNAFKDHDPDKCDEDCNCDCLRGFTSLRRDSAENYLEDLATQNIGNGALNTCR